MSKISVVGLDLAKKFFQVHAIDGAGNKVSSRQLRRAQVLPFFANLTPAVVGMEACGGMHYWARKLAELGHTVKPMAARFIKPYIKSNKSDALDAEAICEAVQRPTMRFVSPKSPQQQAMLHLHHSRKLLVGQRTALINHIRGVLLEFGITVAVGPNTLRRRLAEILEDADNELPVLSRELLATLNHQLRDLDLRIADMEKQMVIWHKNTEASQRIAEIPGIGVVTATAMVSAAGNGHAFRNGREFAAWMGLVPKQASTGGRQRLLGISKRGDRYLRTLAIHGARSVVRRVRERINAGKPSGNPWVEKLLARRHPNVVVVALANRNARIIWALLSRGESYRQMAT
jgi:transposase